jgi:hypothetical protein
MIHTIQNLKTLNLNSDFEFQQLLGSLKYMINIIMRIRDTECYSSGAGRQGGMCSNRESRRLGRTRSRRWLGRRFRMMGRWAEWAKSTDGSGDFGGLVWWPGPGEKWNRKRITAGLPMLSGQNGLGSVKKNRKCFGNFSCGF